MDEMSEATAPRVRQTRGTAEPFTHTRIEREEASQPRRDTTTEEEDQETTDKGDKEKVDISNSTKKTAKPHRHGQGESAQRGGQETTKGYPTPSTSFLFINKD
jgi:hypothetical protein